MNGIQFITDEKGHKVAVQIDLKKHRELWEDIEDVLVSRSRKQEKRNPLDKVKAGSHQDRQTYRVNSYRVALTASAEKELQALPAKVVARLVPRIEHLAKTPLASGMQETKGGDN